MAVSDHFDGGAHHRHRLLQGDDASQFPGCGAEDVHRDRGALVRFGHPVDECGDAGLRHEPHPGALIGRQFADTRAGVLPSALVASVASSPLARSGVRSASVRVGRANQPTFTPMRLPTRR